MTIKQNYYRCVRIIHHYSLALKGHEERTQANTRTRTKQRLAHEPHYETKFNAQKETVKAL